MCKCPYIHENGTISIKEDSTLTYTYPHQSTEETRTENTSTNDEEKLTLIAIVLGTFIPICLFSVLCGYFVFHKKSKTVFIVLGILSSLVAVRIGSPIHYNINYEGGLQNFYLNKFERPKCFKLFFK